jgi:hypothetical protein
MENAARRFFQQTRLGAGRWQELLSKPKSLDHVHERIKTPFLALR